MSKTYLVKEINRYSETRQVKNRFYVKQPAKIRLYAMLRDRIGNYEITEVK